MTVVERLCAVGTTLGEGPLWLDDALWFTDIKERRLYRFSPDTRRLATWATPAQISWVQPAADGTLIAGLQGRALPLRSGQRQLRPTA